VPASRPSRGVPQVVRARSAGARAGRTAREMFRQHPVEHVRDRLLGRRTANDNFRKAHIGERATGRALDRLMTAPGPGRERWYVDHDVHLNPGDVDHLVIGLRGLFVLNSKCHPDAKVESALGSIRVNSFPTTYIPRMRAQLTRVQKRLEAAAGHPLLEPVGIIVPVLAYVRPAVPTAVDPNIFVMSGDQLVKWLRARRRILRPAERDELVRAARLAFPVPQRSQRKWTTAGRREPWTNHPTAAPEESSDLALRAPVQPQPDLRRGADGHFHQDAEHSQNGVDPGVEAEIVGRINLPDEEWERGTTEEFRQAVERARSSGERQLEEPGGDGQPEPPRSP